MQNFNLKKTAVALAVVGAFSAGAANAGVLTVTNNVVSPKVGATAGTAAFTLTTGKKALIQGTTAGHTAADTVTGAIYYFSDAAGTVPATAPIQALGADTVVAANGNFAFNPTITGGTNGVTAVIVVDSGAAGDTWAIAPATQYGYLKKDGTVAAGAYATAADAAAAAVASGAANGLFTLDTAYQGPAILGVTKTGQASAAITFNADLAAPGTGNINAALRLVSLADGSQSGEAVFAGSAAGAAVAAGDRSFVIASEAKINDADAATIAADFTTAYNKLVVLGTLADLAGNTAVAETVYASATVAHGAKPAVATGAAAVLTNFTADAELLWKNDTAAAAHNYAGQFATVTVRLQEGATVPANVVADVNAHVTQVAATKLALEIAPLNLVKNAVTGVTGVSANGTDLEVTLNLGQLAANYIANGAADVRFGVDAATGNLIVSTDKFATAGTPVTIALNYEAGAGNAWASAYGSVSMTAAGDSIAAQNVKVGVVPTVQTSTLDKDVNGWLDGFTIDTLGPKLANAGSALSGTAEVTGTGLSLQTPTAAGTPATKKALASKVYANGATKVQVSLDAPTAAFDWDADGVTAADADDTAAYVQGNFSTEKTNGLKFEAAGASLNAATPSTLAYDQAYRATDGGKLPLVNASAAGGKAVVVTNADLDGAAPVILSATYSKTDVYKGTEFGNVALTFSENVVGTPNLGEFYIDGKAATLWNLDADLDTVPGINFPGFPSSNATLTNLPVSVDGKAVTLAFAGATKLVDLGQNLDLVAGGVAGSTTIASVPDESLKITAAKIADGATYVAGTAINSVVLTLSKTDAVLDAAAPANAKDGMFKIKAVVGARQDSGIEVYDFALPAAAVQLNTPAAGKVTLLLAQSVGGVLKPISLPANTTTLVVDYDQTAAGAGKIVRSSDTTKSIADAGSFVNFNGGLLDGNGELSAAEKAAINDADTQVVSDLAALKLGTDDAQNTGNFFTMTIHGTAKKAGNDLAKDTGVRADLVKLVTAGAGDATALKPAVVGNGYVTIRRILQDNTGAVADGDDAEIALLNKAITVQDLTGVAQAAAKVVADKAAYDKAVAEGAANAAQLKLALDTFGNDQAAKLNANYNPATGVLNLGGAYINAFIEVTTGAGGKGIGSNNDNGYAADNNDASVGRTATLLRTLPNTVKNGTTTYPVTVSLNGQIQALGNTADSAIKGGEIALTLPVLATAATAGTPTLKVLDTAYALVAGGKYQLALGASEKALNGSSTTLESAVGNEAFVLLSVRDPETGNWTLINSAEQSFANYLPFQADLKSAGKSNVLNADVSLVSSITSNLNGGWELKGFTGSANRAAANAAKPVDLSRLFIGVDKTNGFVTTGWGYDADSAEIAFSLNSNVPAMAYQLGAVSKSALPLNTGFGIALQNADANYADDADRLLNDNGLGEHTVSIPLSSATVNTVALKTGWSLVTAQKAETLAAFLARNTAVEAVVIPDAAGAVTWFKDSNANADAALTDLVKGGAAFVYVKQTGTTPVSLTLQ